MCPWTDYTLQSFNETNKMGFPLKTWQYWRSFLCFNPFFLLPGLILVALPSGSTKFMSIDRLESVRCVHHSSFFPDL